MKNSIWFCRMKSCGKIKGARSIDCNCKWTGSRSMKSVNFEHKDKFGDDVVRVVKVFKLLGVHIDCTLSFVTNVEETCKKVRGASFSLKSKFFLSNKTGLRFFKTFVLPHFDYCISLAIYYSAELRMSLVKLLTLVICFRASWYSITW